MLKFTIAICTYNGEKTIKKTIDAILALNSFDELVEEVLVIDNASTDLTKQIVQEYCLKNDKIRYIFESKQGLSNARRRAVDTKGSWVIYVDDDNVLCAWWLTKLKEIIISHPKVGVINGAVIAIPTDTLTEDESIRLQLMRRNLACTHLYSIDYTAEENKDPMGAGMCIITSALKKVENQGWLSLLGRTAENLTSGEDTELCHKIFKMGYKYLCTYDIQLEHLIPKERLTIQYTDRLLEGLTRSKYAFISQHRGYIVKRLFRAIKHIIMLWKCSMKINKVSDLLEYEKVREQIVISRTFLQCVKRDSLIRK